MPDVTGNLAELIGGAAAANAVWRIYGRPNGEVDAFAILVPGVAAGGTTGVDGLVTATLRHNTPHGVDYYELVTGAVFRKFQYRDADGFTEIGDMIAKVPDGSPLRLCHR